MRVQCWRGLPPLLDADVDEKEASKDGASDSEDPPSGAWGPSVMGNDDDVIEDAFAAMRIL